MSVPAARFDGELAEVEAEEFAGDGAHITGRASAFSFE